VDAETIVDLVDLNPKRVEEEVNKIFRYGVTAVTIRIVQRMDEYELWQTQEMIDKLHKYSCLRGISILVVDIAAYDIMRADPYAEHPQLTSSYTKFRRPHMIVQRSSSAEH